MNKNCEILNNIFKSSEMAKYTLKSVICQIKNKNNNIKVLTREILTEYERYIKKIKTIKEKSYKLERQSVIVKCMAKIGISKEIKNDNSDSNISKMIIKGITMGILELEQLLNKNEDIDSKVKLVANDFLTFQKNSIEKLKQFL